MITTHRLATANWPVLAIGEVGHDPDGGLVVESYQTLGPRSPLAPDAVPSPWALVALTVGSLIVWLLAGYGLARLIGG